MTFGVRSLVPLVGLLAGTAFGIDGLPKASAESAQFSAVSLPNNDPPPPVDSAALPDPGPWPDLNPAQKVSTAWLLAEGPAHEEADGRRFVTLTFDDGPRRETTPEVLRLLRQHHVKGTFFFIGRYFEGTKPRNLEAQAIARLAMAEGHLIGTHTHDHLKLTSIAKNEALAQIDDGIDALARVTGKAPILFRPPFGELDAFSEEHLRARGQQVVLWNIEASDMKSSDEDTMLQSLEDQLDYAGGGIVLLHDVRRPTVSVLAKLLDWLRLRQFDPMRPKRAGFVTVDLLTYMQQTAAHPQPYSDRTSLELARSAKFRNEHPDSREPSKALGEDETLK